MSWQIFKNIYFTKGYNRTLVYDILKSDINFIPNDFYDYLVVNNFTLSKSSTNPDYFNFFFKNNLVYKINKEIKELFQKPLEDISIPYDIGVCVIELSYITANNLFKISKKSNNNIYIGQFNFIFSDFSNNVKVLELFVNFLNEYEVDLIELTILEGFNLIDELFFSIKSINRIFIVNNFKSIKIEDKYNTFNNRMYSNIDIKSLKISADMTTFFESKNNHVYFFNKVFIGRKTEIKNSSNTIEVFGYLEDLHSLDILNLKKSKEFKKYWHIKKDETLVCSDCEFKRLCNDNRLPVFSNDVWSHNEECNYNPYISKWSIDENYLNLNDCNVQIKEGKVILDSILLSKINNDLWGV